MRAHPCENAALLGRYSTAWGRFGRSGVEPVEAGESSANRATLLRRERYGKAGNTGGGAARRAVPETLAIPVRQSSKDVLGMEWQPGRRGARSQPSFGPSFLMVEPLPPEGLKAGT